MGKLGREGGRNEKEIGNIVILDIWVLWIVYYYKIRGFVNVIKVLGIRKLFWFLKNIVVYKRKLDRV